MCETICQLQYERKKERMKSIGNKCVQLLFVSYSMKETGKGNREGGINE
jgi:hypothetical protein